MDRAWIHPTTPADWAVRVLTVAVVLILASSYVLWDAVQQIHAGQQEAKRRGCAIVRATLDLPPAELRDLGCDR